MKQFPLEKLKIQWEELKKNARELESERDEIMGRLSKPSIWIVYGRYQEERIALQNVTEAIGNVYAHSFAISGEIKRRSECNL